MQAQRTTAGNRATARCVEAIGDVTSAIAIRGAVFFSRRPALRAVGAMRTGTVTADGVVARLGLQTSTVAHCSCSTFALNSMPGENETPSASLAHLALLTRPVTTRLRSRPVQRSPPTRRAKQLTIGDVRLVGAPTYAPLAAHVAHGDAAPASFVASGAFNSSPVRAVRTQYVMTKAVELRRRTFVNGEAFAREFAAATASPIRHGGRNCPCRRRCALRAIPAPSCAPSSVPQSVSGDAVTL